jgi:putative flippase GtrA
MTGTLWQALRFGLVGLANTVVGLLAIYATIYFFQFGPLVANASGYAIGLILSFILNRIWTFQSNRSLDNVLPLYFLVAAVSYLLNFLAIYFANKFYNVNPYAVQVLGMGIYTTVMFSGCKWLVFRPMLK